MKPGLPPHPLSREKNPVRPGNKHTEKTQNRGDFGPFLLGDEEQERETCGELADAH